MDAPSQSQGRVSKPTVTRNSNLQWNRQRTKSPSPPAPAESATSPPPASKAKTKGFRIGGKAKKEFAKSPEPQVTAVDPSPEPSRVSVLPHPELDSQLNASPKKPKKAFKIGGKNKPSQDAASSQLEMANSPAAHRFRDAYSPTPKSSPPLPPQDTREETTPVEPISEETSEEKAERKRAELKRRNEEMAKKQAQQKKKKRF